MMNTSETSFNNKKSSDNTQISVRAFSDITRQRGQVIPMTLIFIVAVILSLWVMYDSGQLATEKIRLQNTADNVAYSTATLVSRDLNFIAYTNRGMVANQVAIGQMIGLSSYAAMLEQAAFNLETIGDYMVWVPYVGQYIEEVTDYLKEGAEAGADAVDTAAREVTWLNDQIITALSTAQVVFHTTYIGAIPSFSNEIATMNDPDVYSLMQVGGFFLAEAGTLIAAWNQQIGSQNELRPVSDTSDDSQLENRRFLEFEKIVLNSRDRFTERRSYNWGWPFSDRGFLLRWQSRKYGGTDLFRRVGSDDKYKWSWAGMDTVSLWGSFRACGTFNTSWCDYDEWLPGGWGAAHELDEDSSPSDYFEYGREPAYYRRNTNFWGSGAWRNRMAARLLVEGRGYAGQDYTEHNLRYMEGLKDFYDFREDGLVDLGPAVITLYLKDDDKMSSQNSIMTSGGGVVAPDLDADAQGSLISNRLGAIAKAQPYFSRPTDLSGWRRNDRRYEHGNLYNPFWQPRLTELSDNERATATAIVASGVDLGN